MDTLIDVHNPETDFVYDLNADAFVRSSDVGEAAPTRFIAENARLRTYQPAFNGPRNVSNAMRESTLRSLGINSRSRRSAEGHPRKSAAYPQESDPSMAQR